MSTDSDIRTAFRGELSELRDLILRHGAFVGGMLTRAMEALVNQDYDLAEEVRISDDISDSLDLEIERTAMRLLALQQPAARDLRAIAAALRITADLERVGDYSKDIAKVARRLCDQPYFKPLEDIPLVADRCGEMLRLALECFVDRDLEKARLVAEMDNEVDRLWKSLRDELMDHMRQHPERVYQATHLLLVTRYLERIGDHTVNVVERVHYVETGELKHLA